MSAHKFRTTVFCKQHGDNWNTQKWNQWKCRWIQCGTLGWQAREGRQKNCALTLRKKKPEPLLPRGRPATAKCLCAEMYFPACREADLSLRSPLHLSSPTFVTTALVTSCVFSRFLICCCPACPKNTLLDCLQPPGVKSIVLGKTVGGEISQTTCFSSAQFEYDVWKCLGISSAENAWVSVPPPVSNRSAL